MTKFIRRQYTENDDEEWQETKVKCEKVYNNKTPVGGWRTC